LFHQAQQAKENCLNEVANWIPLLDMPESTCFLL